MVLLTLGEFYANIQLLIAFVAGMILYSFFIFKFYKFISKRDIFELHLRGHATTKILKLFAYILEYLVIFPLVIFLWFVIIAVAILLLSNQTVVANILLTSMALTATIRIASYYNESLSQDLAKLLPFVLLGVFLVDISFFSLEKSVQTAFTVGTIWKTPIYYLLFVVGIEFVMRMLIIFKEHVLKIPRRVPEDGVKQGNAQ